MKKSARITDGGDRSAGAGGREACQDAPDSHEKAKESVRNQVMGRLKEMVDRVEGRRREYERIRRAESNKKSQEMARRTFFKQGADHIDVKKRIATRWERAFCEDKDPGSKGTFQEAAAQITGRSQIMGGVFKLK